MTSSYFCPLYLRVDPSWMLHMYVCMISSSGQWCISRKEYHIELLQCSLFVVFVMYVNKHLTFMLQVYTITVHLSWPHCYVIAMLLYTINVHT